MGENITKKNDERRLGQLLGFVRLSSLVKNSMNTHTEMQMHQIFWWDGVWISLNRELRRVDVIRKSYGCKRRLGLDGIRL